MKKIKNRIDDFLYRKLYKKWYEKGYLKCSSEMLLHRNAPFMATEESLSRYHIGANFDIKYEDLARVYVWEADEIRQQMITKSLVGEMTKQLIPHVTIEISDDPITMTRHFKAGLDVWIKGDPNEKA